ELAVLRQGVQALCAGASFWSPQANALRRKRVTRMQCLSALTEAEIGVLRLVAQGKSTKEIAADLHKGIDTVKHQRQSIMDKLSVHNAVALVAFAREAGLVGLS